MRFNSLVEYLLMVQWVVGSIPHGGLIPYLWLQPVLYDWCKKAMECAILSVG